MPSITPRTVSQQMITAAIVEYMNTHPLPGGLPPSAEQVAMAVSSYMAANPVQAGKDGTDGKDAVAPTDGQVQFAVSAFMAEYPAQKGDAGKDATAGMVSTAVADWFAANPVQTIQGNPGLNASDMQVASAVAAWLNANPPASGQNGKSVEIRASGGFIQGRQVGGSWENIVALTDLIGPAGLSVELQKTATAIQWRQVGGAWTDLVLLSVLKGDQGSKGDKGDTGSAGVQGDKGATGMKGDTGTQGIPGAAASIVVGAVTKTAAGTNPTVANSGTPQAAVLDFGIPSGLQGLSLGTVSLTQTAGIAISAGIRTVTVTGVTGLVPSDYVLLFPVAGLTDGYGIMNAWCSANGTLKATISAPLLAIGSSYSLSARVIVLR